MYILMKAFFFKTNYSYGFHIFKLNNLKHIRNLYSQCLTQTLSKMTSFTNLERVILILGSRKYMIFSGHDY